MVAEGGSIFLAQLDDMVLFFQKKFKAIVSFHGSDCTHNTLIRNNNGFE